MAVRRMFSREVCETDAFLDLPATAQRLYFFLGLEADDEGFLKNANSITRLVGSSKDDLFVLIAKGFIIPFESGVIVIRHWNQHNLIQKDRFHSTSCISERSMLTLTAAKEYEFLRAEMITDHPCIQTGSTLDTPCIQPVSSGEGREGKARPEKRREAVVEGRSAPPPAATPSSATVGLQQIAIDLVNKYGLPMAKSVFDDVRHDLETYGEELVKQAFDQATLSDSRGGLSMAFYRSVLDRMAREASA